VILDVFSAGPMWQSSGSPFVAMCSMVLADLKSVGLLAMVELGLVNLLATMFGPPVHAVESLPPPMQGLWTAGGPPPPAARAAAAAAAAAASGSAHFES
jgi:hypothetical protein